MAWATDHHRGRSAQEQDEVQLLQEQLQELEQEEESQEEGRKKRKKNINKKQYVCDAENDGVGHGSLWRE
jgi:hypothetical protein